MQINYPEENVQNFSMKSNHHLCTAAQSPIT